MRVIVTGGDGFIGRAAIRHLLALGHEVAILDRSRGDNIEYRRTVNDLLYLHDAVIHLAGVLGTHELFDSPHIAADINVKGTMNVLQACREHGLRYVGITMPPVFPSVYTATKVCAAHLEWAWHETYGVPVSRVRAFNAFGAGQKHGPGHPQKIVPTFAVEAWAGRPIPIWGDGTQTVDLVHVDDLGRMLVSALEHGGDNDTFDGGTGKAFTVLDVAEMVLAVTGSKAGVEHLPMRRGEVPTKIVAEGEGWDKAGWHPEFDPDVFAETVVSYR